MAANRITWEQFSVCNNDLRGINYRFEDLCRQLFVYEFLSNNKDQRHVHSNPNNAGIESEPIYDEVNKRWIGYQAKFFENKVDYSQIQHSAEKTIEYYKDYLYIFSNKAITSSSDSFKRIVSILNNAGINVQLITDTTILDIVRKYPNLALYYFEHHSFNQKWFDNHAQEIYAKLGDKYNDNFNADTQTALAISMFVHDRDAVEYLNNKKESLLKSIRDLDWRYDAFDEFKTALEVAVLSIPNVTVENIVTCLSWNGIIQDAVGQKLDAFKLEIKNLEIEKIRLDTDAQKTDDDKRLQQIYDLRERIELFEKLISIADSLKLTENESKLIQSNILVLEGKAGVGKSHLLANETKKLLSYGRWVLLLLGGDYSGRNSILEQICSELGVKYSFDEVLELLNTEGEKLNYIVPIFIDAINETWNNTLWKSALPRIFNRIRQLKYVRLVISFRTEYKKVLIDEIELKKPGVFCLEHHGFEKESFVAIKQFLNHYNIPFTPLHMFNQSITNPLFLTLYCKTYQGDDIELPLLYDRLLSVANDNIHKAMRTALENLGYDSSIDLTTPVVMELAKFVILTGKRQFSKREICDLEVWKQYGIQAQAFIQYMVRENILHNYMYKDSEEMFYFSYDQMNDYFCAKQILNQHHLKTELSEYMAKKVLGIQNGELTTYENIDLFVYLCALYADKYHEECISIIDDINDEQDRDEVFNSYVESFKWRNTQNINLSTFLHLCEKYSVRFEMIWDMFITNSLKSQSCFNSNGMHTVLSRYPLNQRDYLWTRYINDIGCSSEHRLVQVIRMYSEGKGLTFTNRCQVELLLVLFSWILTSSNRWLRDTTSKAMVEVLKQNFDMAENLLRKFEEIDDPYIIQRMYGVVWGACVKKGYIDKQIFNSLTKYVYEKIFSAKIVYPDILLRDYAKLIVERYMYENPDDNSFDVSLIMPPYSSEPIPQIVDQGYLENNYKKGLRYLISSMRFQNSGWYGDFGRYVYESALNHFDVDHSLIFNFSVLYIINDLGYSNELFGEYDGYLQEFNYNRHSTNRVERIGKKYQWIAMYHVLARVADNCKKKDSFSLTSESYKYQGPWDPDVRDFDPSLSEYFMSNKNLPLFYNSIGSKIGTQKGDQTVPNSTQEELA